MKPKPDFNNLLKVLKKEKPDRPTLFEYIINDRIAEKLAGDDPKYRGDTLDYERRLICAYANAGYDYVLTGNRIFAFPSGKKHQDKSASLNEGALITDWASFEAYKWPVMENINYDHYKTLEPDVPEGMKLVINGPCGVLENVIRIVGFDNLCFMIFDEPELVELIFNNVGERLLKHYQYSLEYDIVGALMVNDDWGFNTQTMLSTDDMRKYVFPWHKKIIEATHAAGRPAMLHSCGKLDDVYEDIITDLKFDGKHSYEDNIEPVEEVYEKYVGRLAILGGMDLDFICRSTPEQITKRCEAMLERTADRGGYALGTGNSVPDYVPDENYLAMIDVVRKRI